jgi:hypothetical protein
VLAADDDEDAVPDAVGDAVVVPRGSNTMPTCPAVAAVATWAATDVDTSIETSSE